MLPIFNNKSRNADGRMNFIFRPATGILSAYMRQGWAADPATMMPYVEFAGVAVPSTALRYQGIAFTTDGAMYITSAVPTSTTSMKVGGVAVRLDGAVHVAVSTSTVGLRSQGQALGVNGELILSAAFIASLSDLGAGAVNTANLGTGTLSFTRATTAWTKLSTGLWAEVASGTARAVYTGANTAVGTYAGYYAELAATNLALHSRDLANAAWALVDTELRASVAKTGTGIDGVVNSSTRLSFTAGTSTLATLTQVVAGAAVERTLSVFGQLVTSAEPTNVSIELSQDGVTFGSPAAFTSAGSGIYDIRASYTATQLNPTMVVRVAAGPSATVVFLDMAQLETAASPTSPIPTTTAAVTRNADVLDYTGAADYGALGSMYCEATPLRLEAGTNKRILSLNDGTANEQVLIYSASASATSARLDVMDGGATQASIAVAASLVVGTTAKLAGSWTTNLVNFAAGGTLGTQDTVATMPTTNKITIGALGTGTGQFGGGIKNVFIWSITLSASDLRAITT